MIRGAGAAAAAAAAGAAARRSNYAQVSSTELQTAAADEQLESYQHEAAAAAATTSDQGVEMSSPVSSAASRRIGAAAATAAAASSRQRRQYSRLSVSAGDDEEGILVHSNNTTEATASAATTAATGSSLSNKSNKNSTDTCSAGASYTTTSGLNNNNTNEHAAAAAAASSSLKDDADIAAAAASFYPANDDGRRLIVIILDVAQKKFSVTVHPDSTVQQLKRAGFRVHKVPADRQRLIYRGKMLQDDVVTLKSVGIVEDSVIVHLFPKPRVVIKDANDTSQKKNASTNESNNEDADDDDDTEGARVPTIVLDSDEAERRSQILVLGSADYVEAQNNVKLFSFMLLIISTIELMTLLSVALGVQQEQDLSGVSGTGGTGGSSSSSGNGGGYPYVYGAQDDVLNNLDDGDFRFNNNNNNTDSSSSAYSRGMNPNDIVYAHWTLSSWFDLLISVLGVYVAILGIKASSENTHRLAQWYLYGTLLTGLGWMLWNFIMTYKIDVKVNENRQAARNSTNISNNGNTDDFYYPVLDNDDIVWQAVSVMVLPGMVWFMCCLKAWQFQYLLREAEQEAEERIRSEWSAMEQAANGTTTTTTTTTTNNNATGGNDEELALQNPSATIS